LASGSFILWGAIGGSVAIVEGARLAVPFFFNVFNLLNFLKSNNNKMEGTKSINMEGTPPLWGVPYPTL
jgi:hypothetical protein